MEQTLLNFVVEVNGLSIERFKDKIRTKIYKEIEKIREDDEEFSKKFEFLEKNLFIDLTSNYNDSNLNKFIKIYNSLRKIEYAINEYKEIVDTN